MADAKLTDRRRSRGKARLHTGSNPVLTTNFKKMNWKSIFSRARKKDIAITEEYWFNYSDLTSPNAYQDCADYDGMGDYSRFPNITKKQ